MKWSEAFKLPHFTDDSGEAKEEANKKPDLRVVGGTDIKGEEPVPDTAPEIAETPVIDPDYIKKLDEEYQPDKEGSGLTVAMANELLGLDGMTQEMAIALKHLLGRMQVSRNWDKDIHGKLLLKIVPIAAGAGAVWGDDKEKKWRANNTVKTDSVEWTPELDKEQKVLDEEREEYMKNLGR